MKCKRCNNKFRMTDIPVEERIYDKFSARFQCPGCKCWLQADKRFKFASTLGLALVAISSVTGVLNSMNLADIDKTILFLVAGTGITTFIWSSIVVQLEVVE